MLANFVKPSDAIEVTDTLAVIKQNNFDIVLVLLVRVVIVTFFHICERKDCLRVCEVQLTWALQLLARQAFAVRSLPEARVC